MKISKAEIFSSFLLLIDIVCASPCKDREEFYDEKFGCRSCPPCPKGYGIYLNEKLNSTANGTLNCYSCTKCLPGTYQNDIEKPKACQPCNPCLNRETLQNCSIEENAICGKYQTGGSILLKKIEKARALPCKYIGEFYQKEYGCQPCPPCPKGYGVDLNEKVNRTANGMMSCYSCKECLPGTYQNDIEKPKACQPCNPCLNRETLIKCSSEANALCGKYLPGFFQTFENGIEVQPGQPHSRASSQLRALGITLILGIIITIL